jgi:hypothetical protein
MGCDGQAGVRHLLHSTQVRTFSSLSLKTVDAFEAAEGIEAVEVVTVLKAFVAVGVASWLRSSGLMRC